MLFDNAATLKAIAAIRDGARQVTKEEVCGLLELARKRKPVGLDDASRAAQVRYHGNQKSTIERVLRKRFPNTQNMPCAPINWMKQIARADAGVYIVKPDRWIEDDQHARVATTEPAGELWDRMLTKSRFHLMMAECERRASITPGLSIGEVVWWRPPSAPASEGYPHIHLYWVHDVEVLCHWQAPTSWLFRYCVMLRQAPPTPTSKGQWWKVWSRVPPDTIDGVWGPWFSVVVSDEGEQAAVTAAPTKYEADGDAPTFLVQLTEPEGSPFAFEDSDLIAVVDDLNEQRSNESFVIQMQGHDQVWTNDTADDAKEWKTGPDGIWQTESAGATIGVITHNPALTDMRESRKLGVRELAISRGNSPHAYDTDTSSVPATGIAKMIDNIAHDDRIEEQRPLMQVIEEEGPLPILHAAVRKFHPLGSLLDGTKPRMMPLKKATLEDPTQRQTRLFQAVDRGVLSEERAAAGAELYSSVEEAKQQIEGLAATEPPPAPPAPPTPPGPPGPPQPSPTPKGG